MRNSALSPIARGRIVWDVGIIWDTNSFHYRKYNNQNGRQTLQPGRAQDGFGEVHAEEARRVRWERPQHGRSDASVERPGSLFPQQGPERSCGKHVTKGEENNSEYTRAPNLVPSRTPDSHHFITDQGNDWAAFGGAESLICAGGGLCLKFYSTPKRYSYTTLRDNQHR